MQRLLNPDPHSRDLQLFRRIYAASVQILRQHGRIEPIAFIRAGRNPKIHGVPTGIILPVQLDMPGSDTGKDAVANALRHVVAQTDADLVLMVLESWMVKPNTMEAAHLQRTGEWITRPSEHPDRQEIVLFNLAKPGGDSWSAFVTIHRDGEQKPSIPSQPPRLEYMAASGRFGNLFEQPVPLGTSASITGGIVHEQPPTTTTS